jgi:hypothetical protein
MSVHTVEQVLWEICNVPERTVQMRADPGKLVAQRNLTDEERRMVRDLDVRGLAAYSVNQMLIMMTWNILVGAEKIPEYLAQLNGTAAAPSGIETRKN